MKNQRLFLLFVATLCSGSHLTAQSVEHDTDEKLQAAGLNNQSSSPLMMFSGDEEKSPTDATTDPRSPASRSTGARGAASADSSSDAARGTASGLAEEGEGESLLTLNHFRIALAKNQTATRFVIVEDEERVISIEPRAAGTSKFALSKNKLENTTIIDALRELLVTRHGGSSEIADSFFDGVSSSADTPLSAERLRDILNKLDVAKKPRVLKKTAAQKTPPPSASENEATSPLDDSNVDEYLGTDIRGHLQTLEKITLAESLSETSHQAVTDFKKLQKAERRKKREQKVLASALESDTEGYMTPGTFLKSAVLKTAQAEMATSLLKSSALPPSPEIKKSSAVERNIEGYIRNAESQRDKALASSLAAEKSKNKASSGKGNIEQEGAAYDAAAEAWNDVVVPYESAWEAATHAHLDTRELTTFLREAEANELYWRANLVALEARTTEHGITSTPTETHSSELAVAWTKSIDAYQAALSKEKEAGLENPKWITDLANAQTQQATWSAKAAELKFAREEAEINDQEQTRRASFQTVQAKAEQAATAATTAATTAQTRASQVANTMEAAHWNAAVGEARKTENTWQQVIETCQELLSQAPARFQGVWRAELKKATDSKASWTSKITSLESQKNESIICAQTQAAAEARLKAVAEERAKAQAAARERQEEEERADQEGANAMATTAHNKVAEARAKVNKTETQVVAVRQIHQQATARVAETTARVAETKEKIARGESEIARLTRELEVMTTRAREARNKGEKKKYSLTNAFGLSHSKQEAIAAAEQTEREARVLRSAHEKAETELAKLKRENVTLAEEGRAKVTLTEAEATLTQIEGSLAEATSALNQLQKEETEAIRWASLTPSQRATERAAALAEVKALAARPCGDGWEAKADRGDEIMALVRSKIWPLSLQAIRDFNEQPSEVRLLAARKSASAFVSASASASAYIYFRSSSAKSYAYDSASVSAYASAYAASSASAKEVAEAAGALSVSLEAVTEAAANYRRWGYPAATLEHLDWLVEAAREVVTFSREVAKYRAAEEIRLGKQKARTGGAWARGLEEVKALAARPLRKDFFGRYGQAKRDRAKDILEVITRQLWPSVLPVLQVFIDHPSKERMIDGRTSASASASAFSYASASSYEYSSDPEYGSQYSSAIELASSTAFASAYAYLSASASVASTLTTAEEAAEAAKAAAAGLEASKNAAAQLKLHYPSETTMIQELNKTVERTQKLVEFAHAVAAFKARQEVEQGSGASSASAASGAASPTAGAGASASSSSSSARK